MQQGKIIRIWKATRSILAVLAALVVACLFLVQIPAIQTAAARYFLKDLSSQLDCEITVGHVHIFPLRTIVIKDVFIKDKHPHDQCSDTLAYVKTLTAVMSIKGFINPTGLKNYDNIELGKALINVDKVAITGGEFNLVIEEGKTGNIQRVFNIADPIDVPLKSKEKSGTLFYVGQATIDDFRYTMRNFRIPWKNKPETVDYANLDLKDIKIAAEGVSLSDKIVRGDVSRLSFHDVISGYEVYNITGHARVGRGLTHVENFTVLDPWSNALIDSYKMIYDNNKSFVQYVDLVTMDAVFNDTHISMRTISSLAGGFCHHDIPIVVNGTAHGPLNDLHWNVDVASEYFGAAKFNGGMKGVTQFATVRFDTEIQARDITTSKVAALLEQLSNDPQTTGRAPQATAQRTKAKPAQKGIAKFAPGMDFAPHIHIKGTPDSLNVNFKSTDYGTVQLDVIGRHILDDNRTIKATAATDNFQLGRVLASPKVGALSATAKADVQLPRQSATGTTQKATAAKPAPAVTLHSLEVRALEALDYTYTNITAQGAFKNQSLDLQLNARDPNLHLDYSGNIAKSKFAIPDYDFYLNVPLANLTALHIIKKDDPTSVAANIVAQRTYVDDDTYNGVVNISNIKLINHLGLYTIRNFDIDAFHAPGTDAIQVTSPFFEATYSGENDILSCIAYLKEKLAYRHFPSMQEDHKGTKAELYHLDAKFITYTDAFSYFVDGLYIEKGTELYVNTTADDNVKINLTSGRLAVKKTNAKDVNLSFESSRDELKTNVQTSALNAVGFDFENGNVNLRGANDSLRLAVSYHNTDSLYNAHIALGAHFYRDRKGNFRTKILTERSNVSTHHNNWIIAPAELEGNIQELSVKNFELASRDQSLKIKGSTRDTLTAQFRNIDLWSFRSFLPDIKLRGTLNGDAKAMLSTKDINGNIKIDSTSLNGVQLGFVGVNAGYKGEDQRLGGTIYSRLEDGRRPVALKGSADFESGVISGTASFDKFNLTAIEPFLTNILTDLHGELSGNLEAGLSRGEIDLKEGGRLNLNDVGFKVGFTGVAYALNGDIITDKGKQLKFNNITVKDTKGGDGLLTGTFDLEDINRLSIDAQIAMDELEAVDLKTSVAGFSGNIYTSGTVGIKGPLNDLELWSDATVAKPSTLVIPLWRNNSANASKILTFLTAEDLFHNDDYAKMLKRYSNAPTKRNGNFRTRLAVAASEILETKIELGEYDESAINAKGRGNIVLSTSSQTREFGIKGDYLITEGNFHFNAVNIVTRDFVLENGSSLKFNGPIMNSSLDVRAIYKTKANVGTLIADTTSTSTRKNVDCIVKIGGAIVSPVIDFDISVPDLDPMSKSKVENALITKDKIQRQFFSLLISNSFMPNEESGIVNNSTVVYSNVTEIMANQVSRILHKLDIPVDLGLNYQPQKNGRDVFDVAISTQLFNNRVEVGGSLSNGNKVSGGISGDVDVEVKVNRAGTLRVKAFSHSPNEYNYFMDNSQRNGVGISFQKEFSTFRELFTPVIPKSQKKATKKVHKEVKQIKSKHKKHGRQ